MARRVDTRVVGFRKADAISQGVPSEPGDAGGDADLGLLGQVQPHDLIRFGFIPEFIGRLPVSATLSGLDEQTLVQILTAPRNSLVKQYQKLFEYENIELVLDPTAMQAIAKLAVERDLGARGLRMIMEDLMLELMYYLPSQPKRVKRFVVTEQMVLEDQKKFRARLLDKAG